MYQVDAALNKPSIPVSAETGRHAICVISKGLYLRSSPVIPSRGFCHREGTVDVFA